MTAAQRRKINRQNASKSTGPKTQVGRDRARRNALKHGLCSSKLALPGEEPSTLKAQRQGWIDSLQPQTPAEVSMIDEAVRADLRLKRCARAEHARLEEQVFGARRLWVEEREDRLAHLTSLLATDPATAARELRRFGHGCRWLIERWREIERTILRHGICFGGPQVADAVRLLGADIKQPKTGPVLAYGFRLWNAAITPEANAPLIAWLRDEAQWNDRHRITWGNDVPSPTAARDLLLNLVRGEIADLERREAEYKDMEWVEQTSAVEGAKLPPDTPKTRLYLRYHGAAISSLHRALNTLLRLQTARRASEAEAAEMELRNEANGGSEPQVSGEEDTLWDEGPASVSVACGSQATGSDDAAERGGNPVSIDVLLDMPIVPVAPPLGDSA